MPESMHVDRVAQELVTRFNLAVRRGTELWESTSTWRASQPLDTVLNLKSDGMGWTVEVTKVDPAPALDEWGILYGEIAHHFRSVLNTMLTRIAQVEGIPVNRNLQFPITQDHRKWVGKQKGNGDRDRLRGFPERIVRAVYAIQPFVMARQHGKDPMYDVLAVLAWTNNQDKHHIEMKGNLTPYSFVHDFAPVFSGVPADDSREVPVTYSYDYSLEIGSNLVDANSAPFVVIEIDHYEYDLVMEVGVLDEVGELTPLRLVLEEFREKVSHIIQVILTVWSDPLFEVDDLAGSSDFQRGASFGRAAVDGLAGRSVWDKDFLRSKRGDRARAKQFLEQTFRDLDGPV